MRNAKLPLKSPSYLDQHRKERMDTFIGFHSAWTGNPKAPSAIAAVSTKAGQEADWHPPQLVPFDGALAFIQKVRSPDGRTIVALDQPTVVPNATGDRPVERVAMLYTGAVPQIMLHLFGLERPRRR